MTVASTRVDGRDRLSSAHRVVGRPSGPATPALLLGGGFAAAVAIRAALAGPAGAASRPAAVVFAVVLAGLAVAARTGAGAMLSRRAVAWGVGGALLLALPAVVADGWWSTGSVAAGGPAGFASWAALTAVVATAEEGFLRGALFAALQRWRGPDVAVAGAAVAFAALHVPLYGWHVVPLDLAVGLVLGAVRLAAGTWTASAVAHVGADLVGWWLV